MSENDESKDDSMNHEPAATETNSTTHDGLAAVAMMVITALLIAFIVSRVI